MGIEEDLELQLSGGDSHGSRDLGCNLKEFQPMAG